ncbi:MAG TPA: ADP-ribosylglycohydrolase family protein [Oscillospiraceae bacterium]|nr:ADP-ribosylglycohydrolase family protein [Oscillospiraceae bacterium]HXK77830.1 ADP-ribosylglycohydrolase family protein [Oscillospiraceae bacterium]
MLGAMIGDITGSRYEFHNIKTTDFPLMDDGCFFTDATVTTLAVAEGLMNGKRNPEKTEAAIVKAMQKYGRMFPEAGYGARFGEWLQSETPEPYGSYGSGSAMRVSPVAEYFHTLAEAEQFAEISARVTHSHPEGIKGAQAVAAAVFLAGSGRDRLYIKRYIELKYHYDLSRSLDTIRPDYTFDETCQGTVPEAITAFLLSESFEDAVRKAVSLGGDSSTLAAVAGSIAEAFYGIPAELADRARSMLDKRLLAVLERWDGDLSVRRTGSGEHDILKYLPYFEKNPKTEYDVIKPEGAEEEIRIPHYDDVMQNFIRDFYLSDYVDKAFSLTLSKHGIRTYEDMVIELPFADRETLCAMLTLVFRGELVSRGNIARAAESGIIGDILGRLAGLARSAQSAEEK